MRHEEFLSRMDGFTDSVEDTNAVLLHASACADCRREARFVDRELSHLGPGRRSTAEEVARIAAAAAAVVMVVVGMHSVTAPSREPTVPRDAPRYRIVGDASGVMAYTPGGVVVGVAGEIPQGKE